MKVLIQHPTTFEYLSFNNQWTEKIGDARNFGSALNAVSYGVNQLKEPFLMLFKFLDTKRDFTSFAYALHVPRPTPVLKYMASQAA